MHKRKSAIVDKNWSRLWNSAALFSCSKSLNSSGSKLGDGKVDGLGLLRGPAVSKMRGQGPDGSANVVASVANVAGLGLVSSRCPDAESSSASGTNGRSARILGLSSSPVRAKVWD